jgi:hypothetical protein
VESVNSSKPTLPPWEWNSLISLSFVARSMARAVGADSMGAAAELLSVMDSSEPLGSNADFRATNVGSGSGFGGVIRCFGFWALGNGTVEGET